MKSPPPVLPLPVLRTRLSAALLAALDRAAGADGQSRSALVRAALVSDLTRRGLWPPRTACDAA